MIYTKIQNEHQHIANQIKNLTSELAKYPNGHLTHARNGNYYKWYHSDGKTNTYIPVQNIEFARQLAIKKYLTLKLEDLKQEQRALEYYLRHHKTIPGKAEMLLQNTPGIQALISPYFKPISQELYDWANAAYESNQNYPEQKVHKTSSGHMVRSKSEAMIAMHLYSKRIPFRYECILPLGESTLYPDFTIRHPQTGQFYYWEHFGLMDDSSYCRNAFSKLQLYASFGIIPTLQRITTYENRNHPFNSDTIEKIIQEFFL